MPIGNLDVPLIGKNVVIAVLVQTHILIAAFILGAALIAPTAEYLGMVTKQPKCERFARNLAKLHEQQRLQSYQKYEEGEGEPYVGRQDRADRE